jgi:cytidine deaminase
VVHRLAGKRADRTEGADEMTAPALAPDQQQRLRDAAREALEKAYAPFSRFQVGSAVLTEKGGMYTGCNVENSSYGLTNCAERSAIFAAVGAEGPAMKIRAIAVVAWHKGHEQAASPCGACRQVIFEFGPDAFVLFLGPSGLQQVTISDLLPGGFRL